MHSVRQTLRLKQFDCANLRTGQFTVWTNFILTSSNEHELLNVLMIVNIDVDESCCNLSWPVLRRLTRHFCV